MAQSEIVPLTERLMEWKGEVLVADCRSPFVAIGTLVAIGSDYVELADADLHDLRDSDTTRELYLVQTVRLGVRINRERTLLRLDEVVGLTRLADIQG